MVEKFDGFTPWPGYEALLKTTTLYYSVAENLQRIRQFAAEGRHVAALRLYRSIYDVDLRTAIDAVDALAGKT